MSKTQIDWVENTVPVPDDVPCISIGDQGSHLQYPYAQILLTIDDTPSLLVTLRSTNPECFTFQDARVWHRLMVVGWGCSFYLVHLDGLNYSRQPVDTYFGEMCLGTEFGRGDDFLLVACGERVTRIAEDGSLVWVSGRVGIDGVVIGDVRENIITGSGEWDPPGRWQPFSLCLLDGKIDQWWLIQLESRSTIETRPIN